MKIPKTYKIITIQDALDYVTKYNIDSFMSDLRAYIEMTWAMQELFNSLADAENIPQEAVKLNSVFHWVDDGKQEHKILFSAKNI